LSIIHDALKKAEKSINVDVKAKVDKQGEQFKFKLFLIYGLVACLGLFIGNIVFGFLSNPKSSSRENPKQISIAKKPDTNALQESPKEAPAKPKEVPPLETTPIISRYSKTGAQESPVLNGIFFSENEGYALINNQIVKVGDVVCGATVKRISIDGVELEVAGSIVKLTTRQR